VLSSTYTVVFTVHSAQTSFSKAKKRGGHGGIARAWDPERPATPQALVGLHGVSFLGLKIIT
jgi:hypothetical protein